MIKQFLFAFLCLCSIKGWTYQEVYSPNLDALYQADLVLTCRVHPGTNFRFEVSVLNILKNTSDVRVQNNQLLFMHGSMWSGFGQKENHHAEAYVLYLKRYKNGWKTYTHQHEYALKKGNIPFSLGDTTFYLTVSQYRNMRIEMFTAFERGDECTFRPLMSAEAYARRPKKSIVVTYLFENPYAPCELIYADAEWVEELEEDQREEKMEEANDFCSPEPQFPKTFDYMKFIDNVIPDSVANNPEGIEGKYYVMFTVEKDSTITEYQLLRSISPAYENAVKNAIEMLPPITPGALNGKVARCHMRLPVPIRRR